MKKILIFLLIISFTYIIASLYFLDKYYFLCPIDYEKSIVIRCDGRGKGFFAADRSGNRLHQGIDLLAGVGTPVKAARCGKVIANRYTRGMGNYVIIRHFSDLITIYGHLLKIYVAKGQYVRQGDIIGAVGKTGNANHSGIQPHLHFEVRKKGIPEDPLEYLQ